MRPLLQNGPTMIVIQIALIALAAIAALFGAGFFMQFLDNHIAK